VTTVLSTLGNLRAVLVTGKGGVGKTTVTASIARMLAASGRRVLCGETAVDDQTTSPLGAALGVEGKVGEDPTPAGPNLDVVILQATRGHRAFLRDALKVNLLADAALRSAAIRRFLMAAPSFPEMGMLYRVLELVRLRLSDGSPRYHTVVLDLPATGHALALAQIPSSLLRILPGGPIVEAVKEGLGLIMDPAQTGSVVVTLPETLPVSEALELADGIRKHQLPLAAVVANRVPYDPFSAAEKASVLGHVKSAGPTLGVRSLERIERSRAALARLAEARGDVPMFVVHDSWAEGAALPAELAVSLAGGVP